jgi:hypothetical protein
MNGFSRVCIVKGAAFFNDKIDGDMVDSGTVFIEEALDESSGRARGVRTVDYRCPDHQVAKELIGHELPGEFEVNFEVVTAKKTQTIKVVGFKRVGKVTQPQPMPKAA